MEKGDLASSITPRFLFIWEDLIANLKDPRHEAVLLKIHRWGKAVDQWETNPLLKAHVWDLWLRYDLRCDVVVTTRPREFATAAAILLDSEDWPFQRVLCLPATDLARKLAYMPDVAKVFFGNSKYQFAYGRKGVYVPDQGKNFLPMNT